MITMTISVKMLKNKPRMPRPGGFGLVLRRQQHFVKHAEPPRSSESVIGT
jgi:hypothetical protein